jgi:hypothetical protein
VVTKYQKCPPIGFAPEASYDRSKGPARKIVPGVSACVLVWRWDRDGDWLSAPYLEIAPGMANRIRRRVKHDISWLVKREANPLGFASSSASQLIYPFR